MENAWDYDVKVEIRFDISRLHGGDLNTFGIKVYFEKEITRWVYNTFEISDYQQEDVPIGFNYVGEKVIVTFHLDICDDNIAEAESYVDYCITLKRKLLPIGIVYNGHCCNAKELGESQY